jgi:hypothetical protein
VIPRDPPEAAPSPRRRIPLRGRTILYALCLAGILAVWVLAYRAWFLHTVRLSPDVVFAVPWVQSETIPLKGVFLWNEFPLVSPVRGGLRLPQGAGPVKVARGALLARVEGSGRSREIRAPDTGIFVAASDGEEGRWRYSRLWPDPDRVLSPPASRFRKEGDRVEAGEVLGRLIPQPQELRAIGFLPADPKIDEQLRDGRLLVRMDPLDTPAEARIRVYERYGGNVKLYVSLPWFPPALVVSRRANLLVRTGEVAGVAVPETAVTIRDGRMGVFQVEGNIAVFREIRGQSLSGGRYLISSGLKLGDAVVADGDGAEEGRIRLW